jgi:hypothetical protein
MMILERALKMRKWSPGNLYAKDTCEKWKSGNEKWKCQKHVGFYRFKPHDPGETQVGPRDYKMQCKKK